jgi:predicted negative regulator of RcsB-dependent stress response
VEIYENENDQVDALKRFFAENGKALAVGVILGIGALVGWRYWTSHQQDTAETRLWLMKTPISALKSNTPEALTRRRNLRLTKKHLWRAGFSGAGTAVC